MVCGSNMKSVNQAVLMAAGKSTRTYPLTITRPKPMLPVANKPILAHNLDQLVGLVKEVIIIVGYHQDQIRTFFKNEYRGLKIIYVEQTEALGTGHATLMAEPFLKGDRFLLMNGDDLYSRADIEKCLVHKNAVLAKEVDEINKFGIFCIENGRVTGVIEKPQQLDLPSRLANIGLYVFEMKIFDYIRKIQPKEGKEIELTEAITIFAKDEEIRYEVVSEYWLPVAYPWELLNANEVLMQNLEGDIEGIVENNVTIKGKVVIGKNTVVRSGAYLEGPIIIGENCVIGPNCFIRGATAIGDNSHIGHGVEVKNSIIMANTWIHHLSYIGDSVIGEHVNIGAMTVTANWRHDNKPIRSYVKGQLIDTKRAKLGAIIGDGVHTGIHTSIYPGRKIWPYKTTLPSEIVRVDITEVSAS